jgi:SAM-dependent methyltransferase
MRKDYIRAAPDDRADETAFVERFWTEQWRDRTAMPDVSGVARREEFRLMAPWLAQLPRGSRVLDGGCGLGEWTVYLAQQGFQATGIDLSEATVTRLRQWFPDYCFVAGDLRRTPFADASFDAYFSWGTFEHFEVGLGDCLAEARRLVRPGGLLFVSVPLYNWRLMLRDARRLERWDPDYTPGGGYAAPQRFYQWRLTSAELRRELEHHGFAVRSVDVIGKLTGAGRMLQWDLPVVKKGTRAYNAACRALAACLPSPVIGHMILAAAERR